MNETERNAILKLGLLLVILEGWTTTMSARARLGTDVDMAVLWLVRNGYVEVGELGAIVRWRVDRDFESLWGQLIPERGCPVRLCNRKGGRSRTIIS